ncbi:MAG TPA: hypothetical protein PKY50_14575 [Candidatus Competibacter sp.]|nr:hypothetical protein [Candidatus Competibacter sp.]
MAVQTKAKWSMVAAIGLVLGCAGSGALANDSRVSSTAAYTETAGALLESNGADTDTEVAYVIESKSDSYDPYTCTAAYGDAFCAAFERCMAAHGFEVCYERFSQ